MKLNIRTILCLAALAFCLAASAQNIKPARDKATKKYGYQDKEKNWVIPPTYDDAKRFDDDGCALVKLDGKHGLIDLTGAWVLPAEYDDIGKFDKNGLCELTIKEGKVKYHGVADRSGAVLLPVQYRSINIPKNGGYITASTEMEDMPGTPLWGVFDMQGKELFAPQFLAAPSVNSGTFIAKDAHTGLSGVGSLDGDVLLPFEYLTVSRHGNGFRTLGCDFTQTSFSANLREAEHFRQPGAVLPYDPMGDPVRAAAWHSGVIGTRLHVNQVRSVELQPGHSTRSALCRKLDIDWGYQRFLRLEPFVLDGAEDNAMADPVSGKYYTLKALLYEADGTLVGEVSDRGWIEAECQAGFLYNAGDMESWLVLYDPNCLALPSYTVSLSGYRTVDHDNVYNGLGISSYDVERYSDARKYATRRVEIIEKDNVGITSYLPPAVDLQNAWRVRDVSRSDLFHHVFRMGDVVSCQTREKEGLVEVELYEQLVCHFEDRFSEPYYSMTGDDVIYWGPNNNRTVRVSLESAHTADALKDDVAGTNSNWVIVLSLYEEDGSWLRTLAKAPFADYAQDGVLVLKPLGIALLSQSAETRRQESYGWSNYRDIRGKVSRTIKLTGAQPLPHTISALEAFKTRGPRF